MLNCNGLLQVSCSCIYFTDVLWPDFKIWHLLAAVFYYQRCYQDLEDVSHMENQSELISSSLQTNHVEEYIESVNKQRLQWVSRRG